MDRIEHDLLGFRSLPEECYYGIQTRRAVENFPVSGVSLKSYPLLVRSLAEVKMASARANHDLGILDGAIGDAIIAACDEIREGKHLDSFAVDMVQGGAGTSTNMNANEVIANRALEILGRRKGEYGFCHPNNHVNLSQSTNDVYPSSVKIALYREAASLITVLGSLIAALHGKAQEFADVIKMGRTQLQDAVPMTLGQTFEAYGVTLEEEIQRIGENSALFLEINMGATAIGTGINADPGFKDRALCHLREITGLDLSLAKNLIEATQDTGAFIMYSSSLKRLAVKLSKISNDLRLLSSGPRAGLNEINLPAMQPGSSIMPGKVNPVIPEVMNQISFKVIGNDLAVTMAAEAGQLELNAMEPIMAQCLLESAGLLRNGIALMEDKCVRGITANREHCRRGVLNSVGLVTVLGPLLGYELSTELAKEALERGVRVYDLVLEKGLLSEEKLTLLLTPENMVNPHRVMRQG